MPFDPTSTPSDMKTIRAFNAFEDAMNVADAVLRNAPERAYPNGNLQAVEADRDALFRAHRVMHNLATQAENRKAERVAKSTAANKAAKLAAKGSTT